MKTNSKKYEDLLAENKKLLKKINVLENLLDDQTGISIELLKQKKQLNLIESNMIDCIFHLNIHGTYLYLSPSNEFIFGYKPEEMIGKNAFDYFHPDDRPVLLEEFIKNLETGRTGRVECRFRCADGDYLWIEIVGNLIRNDDSSVKNIVLVSRTIEERKKMGKQMEAALESLRQNEEKYRNMAENMGDIVSHVDSYGIFIYTSPSHQKIFGDDPQSLIGKSVFERVHPDDRERVANQFMEGVRAKADSEVEYRYRHVDGHYIWVRSSGHSFFGINEEFSGSIVTTSDISERKKVEIQKDAALEALRESEEFLRQTQSIARMGGWKANPETDFLQWTEGVNRIVEVPLDYKPGLIEGMKYYSPDTSALLREKILNTLKTNDPFIVECEIITESGKKLQVEVRGLSHIKNSQFPCVIGTIQDISARKKSDEEKKILEERLQHADKMEAIGTLAGGIAHDFNNLLMGIQGHVSLSLLNVNQSDAIFEMLKNIEEQVQSGADLTRQLLGFARGGRYEVKPADMNEIIDKTSSMFGRTRKEIVIHQKHGKNLWNVEVDKGQMEQVLLNLYVNAWQAMPDGGELYLETENAVLDDEFVTSFSANPGKYVKIIIADTGMGMDDRVREHIFDPFFTTKEMGRGTGLGLAMVYGIVKGHQGLISVSSKKGNGTTFTIYLPASEKEVIKEKSASLEIIKGTETILLVDDERMILKVNRKLLETLGYKVYVASSGREAIDIYRKKTSEIDLVILDMIMPGMSGEETFDQIMEFNSNARFLLTSGYSLGGKTRKIIESGRSGFLQKPFQLEKLSSKIRELLD